jgi:hypothetical protein
MEVVKKPINYENYIIELIKTMPTIYAATVIEDNNNIVYSTDNWDISEDIEHVCFNWDSNNASYIIVSGVKYTILKCEIDCLVATSLEGQGHIIGCKDSERRIITYVAPNGNQKAAIMEIARILAKMNSIKPSIKTPNEDPYLKMDVESFLAWIDNPYGLRSLIKYYIEKDNRLVISKLAKIYEELIWIISCKRT